jgi:hypothetical protein
VGKWFDRRLSVAMGVYSVLVAIGFMTAFGVYQSWHEVNWTGVWGSLGWVLVLIVAPLAWLLVRDGSASTQVTERHGGYSLQEALMTPGFWVFGIGTSLYGLVAAGTSLFNESLLAERGFEPQAFYQVAIIGAFVGMAFNFVGGLLGQKGWLRPLTAAALLVLACSLGSLPWVTTQWQLWAYAVGMGASGGVITVVFFSAWGQLFGQAQLGRIQGAAQMLTVLASAAGPQLMAEWHARTGSYLGLLYLVAAVVGIASVAMLLTPLPVPRLVVAEDYLLVPEPAVVGD